MPRFYYRCPDCLSVVALDSERTPTAPTCAICDVRMEGMGRVLRERLVRDELRCPCDDRCTCASGPSCSCRCGGENHGSGLLGTVQIDQGGIPRVTPPDARATVRRDEWRSAVRRVEDRMPGEDAAARKARGEYLEGRAYESLCERLRWKRELRRIRGLRTHHGRIRALARLTGADHQEQHHDHGAQCALAV